MMRLGDGLIALFYVRLRMCLCESYFGVMLKK